MKEMLERISKLDPKRLALLAAQLQSRLDAVEQARHEPIAIVGMACRFPGGADTPEAFWSLLREGTDAVREVPRGRWDIEALYDPDPDAPGKMATRWGAFLDGVDLFDAPFFGIAPREAAGMDPQQRLLLELAWEALERAAIAPEKLMGSATGVFVGIAGSDYSQLQLRTGLAGMDTYSASGNAHSVAAGRLSFVLGLQGPCFPIDTACSSSLVAVHQAVQSLRAGECGMALTGGVNLILSPETTVALSKLRMMAPDGRCKAFDARADGFVRGEGGALLVLKRLSDAEADGDQIVALIRGSAINQDGRSNGLTAPNGPAQEAVIRAALASAGLAPERIGYVEAHGTGTSLGDPIEVQALAAVLGAGRSEPLPIGSVKANVGHLESAAGIAGLVKLVLALQHREIPPQIHLQSLNPHIPWEELPVTVPTAPRHWESSDTRIGGVSSFGFSGTNAHVIVEEFVERGARGEGRGARGEERPLHLLALSARNEAALPELADRFERHLAEREVELADVCFSANTGRAHFPHRAVLTAGTIEDAREKLRTLAAGETAAGIQRGTAPPAGRPRVAFLFTGQGSQYVNMGRRLFETQPPFRRVLERCDELLRPYLDPPLLSVLYPAPGDEAGAQALLDQTLYTQPALFAFEYALAELWREWGIEPAAVTGHSVGEYVAACVAGVFTLEEGMRLIAERARLMQAIPTGGAMAAVFAAEEEVAKVVAPHLTQLSIAAVNSPEHTVISGAAPVLECVLETLATRGVRAQRLSVSHAFHSPLTNAVLGPFARIAGTVGYRAPRLAMVSNLTGRMATAAEATDPGYWVRHVRQPVRFADGMRTLYEAGYTYFLEIGPSPTLLAMGRRCLPEGAATWLPSLRPKRDDWQQMLDSLAALYTAGAEVDWEGFDHDYPRRRLVLPTYPFQRERHWSVPEISWSGASEPVAVAPSYANGREADRLDDLLYEVAWRPGPRLSGYDAPDAEPLPLPAPGEIAARVAPRVAELSAEHGMARYDEMLPRLDALAAASVVQALHTLGWRFEVGDAVTADSLAERLGVLPRHYRLLGRLLSVLAEEGVLRRDGHGWTVARTPDFADETPRWQELRRDFPQFHTELMLVARCAGSLPAVLRGEADPLQLLFPGGSLADAEKLYQETPVARTYNALVRQAVAAAIAAAPAGRRLRILEIGGGTGGTTAAVLPVLPPERTEYLFTDISPRFLSQAREKFRDYSFVRHELLDITRDPQAQGVAAHAFDLVIAANVLHATPDLRHSLANVQRLLAPEGTLLLYEAMHPQRFSDLTVGLTEGWWSFTDHDLRPDYALLSHARWRALLADLGFTGATVLPDESAEGILAQQALVLARAPRPSPLAPRPSGEVEGKGSWLILADAAGTGHRLAAALRERGEPVVTVTAGTAFHALTGDEVELDPARPGDFERLLSEKAGGWRGVVYLWGLDAALTAETGPTGLLAAQEAVVGGALHLAQALARSGAADSPRLWLVTRGAQPAGEVGRCAAPAQATLWGFGHTLALEHPEMRCVRFDLDPDGDVGAGVAALLAEIRQDGTAEEQVAVRAGVRRVRRLVRVPAPVAPAAPVRFEAEASYLVTGGLRGLGLLVAEWMAERGARHLILVGRSEPSPAAEATLARLTSSGVSVMAARGDVSDHGRVAEILAEAGRTLPPLRGVVHSAGVLDDGVLLQQSWARFDTVFRPKVFGSWNLHLLTRELPLDFFVLYSSGVGLLGAAGQGNHAAANAFLDMLAFYRRGQGLPGISINWGAWADVGAAADHKLAERGIQTFSPAEGLRAFERALQLASGSADDARSRAQLAVLAVDWTQLFASLPPGGEPPLFRELARQARESGETPVAREEEPALLAQLAAAMPNRRTAVLQGRVRQLAAQVLGVGDAKRVEIHQPLQELGLDSLMAVELRNKLGRAVERTLPATLLFEYPTIGSLTGYLASEVLSLDAAHPAADRAPAEHRAEAVTLSEDDLATLLLKKLEHIEAGNQ